MDQMARLHRALPYFHLAHVGLEVVATLIEVWRLLH